MPNKYNIREFSLSDLQSFFRDKNEKAFRAKQVFEWIWKKHVGSFDDMTNLSKSLRNLLNENFYLNRIKIDSFQKSKDNTKKIAFKLSDGSLIEGVLIPVDNRVTACISTQVGCKLGCKFCATGKLGFTRNLLVEEIYDQVVEIKKMAEKEYSLSLTNIVLMGMGEPLLNYANVLKAIDLIISENGLAMSPQRITLSTVGLPKMIKKLADDNVKFHLAVSLHSAIDEKRSNIMPVNKKNSLDELTESLVYFNEKTGTRIIFEYLLLEGINDSIVDAKALAEFCKSFPVKINVIEFNATNDKHFKKSGKETTDAFITFLKSKNIVVNVRRSRGSDIDAACGQLANKKKKFI